MSHTHDDWDLPPTRPNSPPGSRATPPPQGSSFAKWACIGCAILAVLGGMALIAAVAGVGYLGFSVVKEQVQTSLQTNPVIVEHIGTIEELSFNLMASGEIEDAGTLAFDITGTKGTGRVEVRTETSGNDTEDIVGGQLILGGKRYDLMEPVEEGDPEEGDPAEKEPELDLPEAPEEEEPR